MPDDKSEDKRIQRKQGGHHLPPHPDDGPLLDDTDRNTDTVISLRSGTRQADPQAAFARRRRGAVGGRHSGRQAMAIRAEMGWLSLLVSARRLRRDDAIEVRRGSDALFPGNGRGGPRAFCHKRSSSTTRSSSQKGAAFRSTPSCSASTRRRAACASSPARRRRCSSLSISCPTAQICASARSPSAASVSKCSQIAISTIRCFACRAARARSCRRNAGAASKPQPCDPLNGSSESLFVWRTCKRSTDRFEALGRGRCDKLPAPAAVSGGCPSPFRPLR